jgi:hypothetical protein
MRSRFLLWSLPLLVACQAVAPTVDLGICIWQKYQAEPPGTPMSQVVTDIIAACGTDAGTIISTLDKNEPHAMHATVAHGSP